MVARRQVSLVVPETVKTQSTGNPADPVARGLQTVTGYFVLEIMLMVAASREMNADITAVKRLF